MRGRPLWPPAAPRLATRPSQSNPRGSGPEVLKRERGHVTAETGVAEVAVFGALQRDVISSPSLPVVITFKWNQNSNDRTTLPFEFWFHFVPVGACIFGFSSSWWVQANVTSVGDLVRMGAVVSASYCDRCVWFGECGYCDECKLMWPVWVWVLWWVQANVIDLVSVGAVVSAS